MEQLALRERLHATLDELLDLLLAEARGQTEHQTPEPEPEAEPRLQIFNLGAAEEQYEHKWPQGTETYPTGRLYQLGSSRGDFDVLLGETIRSAWGKEDRGRIVVFSRPLGTDRQRYPWTEFVETDDHRWAASIPRPGSPSKKLLAWDPLPPKVVSDEIRRSDECFDSIADGPSMRLVVDRSNERRMIEHGFWCARLRWKL